MKVIVCLDDNHGMLFNKRRQSRDRHVIEDICKMTDTIWISPFSEVLFSDAAIEVKMEEAFLEKADASSFCFVENNSLLPYEEQLEQIIVYKWNRRYPFDICLDISLEDWKRIEQVEFAGFSHEKITKEIYVRG